MHGNLLAPPRHRPNGAATTGLGQNLMACVMPGRRARSSNRARPTLRPGWRATSASGWRRRRNCGASLATMNPSKFFTASLTGPSFAPNKMHDVLADAVHLGVKLEAAMPSPMSTSDMPALLGYHAFGSLIPAIGSSFWMLRGVSTMCRGWGSKHSSPLDRVPR